MNKDKLKAEEFKREDLTKVIELFCLVYGEKYKIVEAKTKWAFENSFSKALVMKNENDTIIAVRGGIEWPLKHDGENIKAIQFHGTCVHPDYRRIGIFSKLTRELIRRSLQNEKKIIFNVSVKASRLGYEKLGWKYRKGFRRLTKFNNKINIVIAKVFKKNKILNVSDVNSVNLQIANEFLEAREKQFKNHLHTPYDKLFLEWRLSNKEENYQLYRTPKCIIVYKIKYVKNIKELIIGEVFLLEHKYAYFKKALKSLTKLENQDLTYTYIFNSHPYYGFYLRSLFTPNPFNYNLHFGTRLLGESNQKILDNKEWGVGFLDIDTF